MLRFYSFVFAVVFIFWGAIGFLSVALFGGSVGGIFKVNAPTSFIHLLIGFSALIFTKKKSILRPLYFQVTGLFCMIWAILGFYYKEVSILELFANNIPLAWFHLIMGSVGLVLGFGSEE